MIQILDTNPPPVDWPRVGLQPFNKFDTKHLVAMSFPDIFMDGKTDPTNKVRRRYVSVFRSTNHLMKVALKVDRGGGTEEYVYPYAMHECMGAYLHDVIEQIRTFSQANFLMAQNNDLKHCTIEKLLALLLNDNNDANLALV